jgi:hypothetical protein
MSFPSFAQKSNEKILLGLIQSDTSTVGKKGYYWGLIKPILESKHKIELRFFSSPAFNNETCYIITFDSTWTIEKITFNLSTQKYEFTNKPIKIEVDTFFNRLAKANIFGLPDQDDIDKKIWYLEEDGSISAPGMAVTDGVCYKVEFKVTNKYRAYEFCNPVNYSRFYNTNIYFKSMADIVNQFESLGKN